MTHSTEYRVALGAGNQEINAVVGLITVDTLVFGEDGNAETQYKSFKTHLH